MKITYFDEKLINEYIKIAKKNMFDLLRNGKSGHIGSSLSCIDILIVLYWIKYKQKRDVHIIISKGHAELAVYSAMKVFKQISSEKFKELGSKLQGHPSKRWIKEIEYSSGSLGQGLSYAIGKAIAFSKDEVFVLLGDGELQEGQVWKALIVGGRIKLSNLHIIIDYNKMQLQGECLFPQENSQLGRILYYLGYKVIEIDGHNTLDVHNALKIKDKRPTILIANTIKGNGIYYMENNADYHSKQLSEKEIDRALNILNNN